MKTFIYKSSLLALSAGLLLTSCDPEIDAPAASSGQADFLKYLAVGNSLTAGFQDNGLYREGQLNSYPAILADQFEEVGGGEFVQPLFTEEQRNGSGYLRLISLASGTPETEMVTENRAIRSTSPVLFTKFTDPVQNLGVPGLKVADIKRQGYGSAQVNPYFERITPESQAFQTYLQRVQQSTDHTFFSLWLGNNDVLSYATSGGASTAASNTITPVNAFDENYSELVGALTANGQEGILVTIPNVSGIPFFTTVGPSIKNTLITNNISRMVAITGAGRERVVFKSDEINAPENGVLFTLTGAPYARLLGQPTGKYWRDLARQVSPSQDNPVVRGTLAQLLLTYAIDTTQMFGFSAGNPWPSALLLDANEQNAVKAATNSYNEIIRAVASNRGLALWDANSYFNTVQAGFGNNNVAYSPAFISGNLFSLDGVHLTPRGYAIVANEMLKAINGKYKANVPTVDETQYRAVLFP